MTGSIKKQAAKIANKAIRQADEQAKATVQEKQELVKRLTESAFVSETEGRDAFANLRRQGGGKLPPGDEVVIARHLYDELPVLKRHLRNKRMGIGDFCIRYGITDVSQTSKELHRLILAPNKNPADVRLRRGAGKYRSLIEAISKITNESVSTLADRVMFGTTLHPAKQMGDLSEAEKVQVALQRMVDKIDGEFDLYEKFMDVARLKAEHITAGGKEYWPLCEPCSPFELWGEAINSSGSDYLIKQYNQELEDATNIRFSFWIRDAYRESELAPNGFPNVVLYNSVLQDSNFFYVPHAPLGVIEFANLPERKQSIADFELVVKGTLEHWRTFYPEYGATLVSREYAINDGWDADKQCPIGQLDCDNGASRGHSFAWLIIYPTQDGSRLMPMLYIAYEEGGPYIMPLSARNLEIFRDAIWFNETEHMSVFDRIKELLGYRPNTPRTIEEGFRRTAPWLNHNPFFKMKQKHADDLQMLDDFCQQQWGKK